jgi:hypothetical protein
MAWEKKYKLEEVSSYNAKYGHIVLKNKKRITLNQFSREKINDLLLDYLNSEHTHKK